MPKILDNIDLKLIDDLRVSMQSAVRADFCVGYFNLRGWKLIDDLTELWSGQGDARTRLLVGMQELPKDELRAALTLRDQPDGLDNKAAVRLKRRAAEAFRQQLMLGAPTEQRRGRAAPTEPTAQKRQGPRQAVPGPPAARQAVPAAPRRPRRAARRLRRQQQPELRRPQAAGRTQRRCAGRRLHPEAGRMVRGPLE